MQMACCGAPHNSTLDGSKGAPVELKQWIVGLALAVVVGAVVTPLFLYSLRGAMGLGSKPKKSSYERVPPWVTGVVERTIFAVLVGLNVPSAATAMMGWLALKLATNWNRKDMETNAKARPFAFTALLGGLVSMFFAALGGMVCSGALWAKYVAAI
jgi:hypothetical protein